MSTNIIKIIFGGGVYLAKNTSQAANVRRSRALQRTVISNESPAKRVSFEVLHAGVAAVDRELDSGDVA